MIQLHLVAASPRYLSANSLPSKCGDVMNCSVEVAVIGVLEGGVHAGNNYGMKE